MAQSDRCPVCGSMLAPDSRFCSTCGEPSPELRARFEQAERETGASAEQLLEQARMADLIARFDRRLAHIEASTSAMNQRLLVVERGQPATPVSTTPAATPITHAPAQARPTPTPAAVVSAPPPAVGPRQSPAPAPIFPASPIARPKEPVPDERIIGSFAKPVAPSEHARASRSASDWEQLVGGRGLAWTGALALIIGAVFFLSLAFSRGWIGPSARVIIGVVASILMVSGGAWFFNRREALFGYALTAVGLGVMSLSMFAATRLYDLVPIEVGLVGTLAAAVAAAVIAVRFNTQIVAAFGVTAALAAPPILGASANATTILFLGVSLIGVAAISLYRSWNWLPLLAFVLAAPQASAWFTDDAPRTAGFVALGAFWLLFAMSACGPEYRLPQTTLKSTSPILLFFNAVFLVQSGFVLLGTEKMLQHWGGLFLFAVALAHGAIAAFFIRKYGDRYSFALLAAWFGLIAFAVAVPLQFNGPLVAIIWAAVAVPFTWYADRNDHRSSRIASILLFALSIVHLFGSEFPLEKIDTGLDRARPFLNTEGGTLAAVLAALAISAYLVRSSRIRSNLTVVGFALVLLAMPFELDNTALIAGWAVMAVLVLATSRLAFVQTTANAADADGTTRVGALLANSSRRAWSRSGGGRELLAITAGLLGIGHLMRFELPYRHFADWVRPEPPFSDRPTLTVAIMLLAMALAILATPFAHPRRGILISAVALTAYLLPFQVSWPSVVLGWSMLGMALLAMTLYDPAGSHAYCFSSRLLLSVGLIPALVSVAPPNRLTVDGASVIDHPFLWSGATIALVVLAIAFGASASLERSGTARRIMASIAGILAIYLVSIAIVDEFQRRMGGSADLDSLQKRAQVALSIFWAIGGVAIFAAGIVKFGQAVRIFGLALLVLATAKVFIYDLSSLDTSYRVLSFVGLGILLLAGSYVYQHFVVSERPGNARHGDEKSGDTKRRPPTPGNGEKPPQQRRLFHHTFDGGT